MIDPSLDGTVGSFFIPNRTMVSLQSVDVTSCVGRSDVNPSLFSCEVQCLSETVSNVGNQASKE